MSIDTTNNFWEAWKIEPPAPKPIFFRLYYDDSGIPLMYSMEEFPGNYIDIDAATFAASSQNVRVINGKIVSLSLDKITQKLAPSADGTSCHPNNVSVIVDNNAPHIKWSLRTYETD